MQHGLGHIWLHVHSRSSCSQPRKLWAAQLQHHAVHREALLLVLLVLHQQLQV
jgi:hypothetical protein